MTTPRFFLPRAVAAFDQVETGVQEMLDQVPVDELQALMQCLGEDPGLEALAGTGLKRRTMVRDLAIYGLGVIALKRDEEGRWRPPLPPGSGAVLGAEVDA